MKRNSICACSAELQALQCSLTSEQIAAKTAELQSQVAAKQTYPPCDRSQEALERYACR